MNTDDFKEIGTMFLQSIAGLILGAGLLVYWIIKGILFCAGVVILLPFLIGWGIYHFIDEFYFNKIDKE